MQKSYNVEPLFCILFLVYTIFFVYGCLVPLNFQYRPFPEILELFLKFPVSGLNRVHRMDWASNFLLGVPLSFFGLGCFQSKNNTKRLLWVSLVFTIGISLSLIVEFFQLYLPNRVSSVSDVFAQLIGYFFGCILWIFLGQRCLIWIHGIKKSRYVSEKIFYLFYLYLFLLFFYNILPFDLTISPVEIYHKFKQGRVLLIPFSSIPDTPSQFLYNISIDIIMWVPVSMFLIYYFNHSFFRAILSVVSLAALIELLQLFVFTRVTDVTDILTGFAGGVMGAVAAYSFKKKSYESTNAFHSVKISKGRIFFLLSWVVLLLTIFWFPFDFSTERSFLKKQVAGFSFIPFINYQAGHEYNAATQVFRKTFFFIPLGVSLYLNIKGSFPNLLLNLLIIVLIGSFAFLVEGGQFFLPGRIPDLTDWLFEISGGMIGYFLIRYLYRHKT